MPLNKEMELKEIYGVHWSSINSPTTFGKRFKKAYDNGSFSNLVWCRVKDNNHQLYKRKI